MTKCRMFWSHVTHKHIHTREKGWPQNSLCFLWSLEKGFQTSKSRRYHGRKRRLSSHSFSSKPLSNPQCSPVTAKPSSLSLKPS